MKFLNFLFQFSYLEETIFKIRNDLYKINVIFNVGI